jgi:hypothetical protein
LFVIQAKSLAIAAQAGKTGNFYVIAYNISALILCPACILCPELFLLGYFR